MYSLLYRMSSFLSAHNTKCLCWRALGNKMVLMRLRSPLDDTLWCTWPEDDLEILVFEGCDIPDWMRFIRLDNLWTLAPVLGS